MRANKRLLLGAAIGSMLLGAACELEAIDETELDGIGEEQQAGFYAFSCGPDLTTYKVISNSGLQGAGVRCVKLIDAPQGPSLVWYGEGRWGNFEYRHVGQADVPQYGQRRARASDITGNGEDAEGALANGSLSLAFSNPGTPNKIYVSGAWSETWVKANIVVGYQPLPKVETCGQNFDQYRAESLDPEEAGFGVRCKLKGSDTWYGEGYWASKKWDTSTGRWTLPNKTYYAHLGSGYSLVQNYHLTTIYGASDICKPGTNLCGEVPWGNLSLQGQTFPNVGDGFVVSAWHERWLPYSKKYAVRVDAIRASNSDGTRPCVVTPAEIATLVDHANAVFAAADIEFLFVEDVNGPDVRDKSNTLLNTLTTEVHPNWAAQLATGNMLARPNKMTVIFRFGGPNDNSPLTGEGFALSTHDFVTMPTFSTSWACTGTNNDQLAHEAGHYFGLAHTFYEPRLPGYWEARSLLKNSHIGNAIFDGDGLSDTPPDPYYDGSPAACNTSVSKVYIYNGYIDVPRHNIMSYYYSTSNTLSPQQRAIVHTTRAARDM